MIATTKKQAPTVIHWEKGFRWSAMMWDGLVKISIQSLLEDRRSKTSCCCSKDYFWKKSKAIAFIDNEQSGFQGNISANRGNGAVTVSSRWYLLSCEEVTKDLGFAMIKNRYNPRKNKSQIISHCKTYWYFFEISSWGDCHSTMNYPNTIYWEDAVRSFFADFILSKLS